MKNKPDAVLLLLLFGIYFVLNYLTSNQVPELIYGLILLVYYLKFTIQKNKSL